MRAGRLAEIQKDLKKLEKQKAVLLAKIDVLRAKVEGIGDLQQILFNERTLILQRHGGL